MKYFPHLKVEFRAVPYSSEHVLQYRISPGQDLTYEEEKSILGLFKITIKKKFKTTWYQINMFRNYPGAYRYSKESGEPYLPVFIRDKKDLEWYKVNFKTVGEFLDYVKKEDAVEEAKWKVMRDKYLENNKIWE